MPKYTHATKRVKRRAQKNRPWGWTFKLWKAWVSLG